MNYEFVNWTLK